MWLKSRHPFLFSKKCDWSKKFKILIRFGLKNKNMGILIRQLVKGHGKEEHSRWKTCH